MMQTIPKWKINIYSSNPTNPAVIFIFDSHYSNVLRKLIEIHFEFEPTKVEIELIKQTGE